MLRKTVSLLLGLVLAAFMLPAQAAAAPIAATMYKNPDCTCCEGHAQYLRQNGFKVDVRTIADLRSFKQTHGIPDALEGCHTIFINGYIVEGHVPVNAIHKLLASRAKIRGISIPGMPTGVPGMEGPREGPIAIYEIADGAAKPKVFMTLP
jgi:hypothetical protein